MTKEDFFMRLFLLVVAHVLLIWAFVKMAQKNPSELLNQKHLTFKVFGGICLLMCIAEGIGGIYVLSQTTFPLTSLEPHVSMNSIIRPASQKLYWGELTSLQDQCVNLISGSMILLAISAYCFYFKASDTKWQVKICKAIFCLLLIGFGKSSTAFHYFDIYEWMNTVIFAILLYFAFREKKKKIEVKEQVQVVKEKIIEEPVPTIRNNEDESRFMPKSIVNTGAKTDELLPDLKAVSKEIESRFMPKVDLPVDDVVLNKDSVSEKNCEENPNNNVIIGINDTITSETEDNCHSEPTRKYCRFCGKEVNYQTDSYCKHCGNKL